MNENVLVDARKFLNKTSAQIKADPHWKTEETARPKKASDMTQQERDHILGLIEAKFGKKK